MCGRAYATYTDEELRLRYAWRRGVRLPDFHATYNLAPSQDALILRLVEGEPQFDLFRWGLVPPWEKEFKTKLSTINAKSETVFESRLYREPALRRRCIVPLSGFFEWKRDGDRKRPFAVHLKDSSIMSIAGIWETWRAPDGREYLSFSILTTSANGMMARIHDRMPVVLGPEQESAWLDHANADPARLGTLLKPCPDSWLEAYEVSTLVNSPKNNTREVLEEVR